MKRSLFGFRSMSKLAVVCMAVSMLFVAGSVGQAQELARARITVIVSIPPLLWVESDMSEVTFTEEEIREGAQPDGSMVVEKDQALRITTTANVPHSLWISASDMFVGSSGAIPVSRLQWRRSGGTDWTPLSVELQLVRESIAPAREEFDVDLRLELEITDPPDIYEGEILFTLQHPIV